MLLGNIKLRIKNLHIGFKKKSNNVDLTSKHLRIYYILNHRIPQIFNYIFHLKNNNYNVDIIWCYNMRYIHSGKYKILNR